jgi:hypothetical protein
LLSRKFEETMTPRCYIESHSIDSRLLAATELEYVRILRHIEQDLDVHLPVILPRILLVKGTTSKCTPSR